MEGGGGRRERRVERGREWKERMEREGRGRVEGNEDGGSGQGERENRQGRCRKMEG